MAIGRYASLKILKRIATFVRDTSWFKIFKRQIYLITFLADLETCSDSFMFNFYYTFQTFNSLKTVPG